MDNRPLGIILFITAIVVGITVLGFNSLLVKEQETDCACTINGSSCPHQKSFPWQLYSGSMVAVGIASLGAYVLFFDKSQKAILNALKKERRKEKDSERWKFLMMGLETEEKKVMEIIREQEGITQNTLKLKADMHKSKLSIVLDGLEKKGLIKREQKGKTKSVHLKIQI